MTAILDDIKAQVEATPVMLYMKGTPQFPQCGFSSVVVQILDHLGVEFNSANVLESDDLRNG
ncbi:glutaredoxin domain-containing protein, partial [Hyphococcus sp.]|uniref:glutaredoxin domain-containing protein n=1 Tax=Hyphococcus sp. TaxID=2038636 RepID=UPI003752D0F7